MNNLGDRFLLSGASGMLGNALHRALAAPDTEILQLVRRSPSPGEIQWNSAADPPLADSTPLEGLTAAIHLSGANLSAHRWTPEYRREIVSSRVDSTRALASTLARLRNPPQALLVASAVGIYGDRADELLNESSPLGSGFLAEACVSWEAAAQPAVDAGIRVVHLRFGVVLSRGAGALARMEPIFRLGIGGRLGSGRQWMSWISLPDLVLAIQFVLQTPALSGPVNVVSPYPVTNAEFTRSLAHQLERPAFIPTPTFALRLVLGQMADEALLASTRAYPRKLLDAGFYFVQPTIDDTLAAAFDYS